MSTATHTARHVVVEFPIGPLTLVRDEGGLSGIYFPGHWTRPDVAGFGPRADAAKDGGFAAEIAQLREYFAGERRAFELDLNPRGTERARQVWRLLAAIPYGETTTYGALAREVGGGISPRAIGGFVGHNPISIIIPCHRVVGSTGSLTGYAGGLDRKRRLLELERAIPAAEPTLW
ncbi:methylated-DNA-[protein]-cysteine S-methyltransferase [Segniliparus rugosus ATCC BAA-974]|uniref:Methylated-DNA--protein-cysteine methyltransferase n=2 Tax=Segniliparus rugosus TaxID=286804 RepID=U1N4W1_SEGRC|nr:methylated-DNA--[protein]-cysteine S-methyltransferase [Segniliparus rugosus]ERG69224.1 methylated-DNA-[protein]-cysteine S-methyltransferase [Segniliparus rugosus ATCC BAA-974]